MTTRASTHTPNGSSGDSLTQSELVSIGRAFFDYYHVASTKRWLKWLAQRFTRTFNGNGGRVAFFAFLAAQLQLTEEQKHRAQADPEMTRIFRYWDDPTGEAAVNHVMQVRGF